MYLYKSREIAKKRLETLTEEEIDSIIDEVEAKKPIKEKGES